MDISVEYVTVYALYAKLTLVVPDVPAYFWCAILTHGRSGFRDWFSLLYQTTISVVPVVISAAACREEDAFKEAIWMVKRVTI